MNWKFINIIALVAIVMTNFSCGTKEDETSRGVEVYKEQHRPQFHFSPKENWMSNPNEMVDFLICLTSSTKNCLSNT